MMMSFVKCAVLKKEYSIEMEWNRKRRRGGKMAVLSPFQNHITN
jgi:hypothetical protein